MLEICYLLPETNIGTLVASIITTLGLIAAKEFNAFLGKRIPIPIPVELVAVSMEEYKQYCAKAYFLYILLPMSQTCL